MSYQSRAEHDRLTIDTAIRHIHHLEAELAALRARYQWLADKVMACDYGDNDKGCIGWHIKHCKGPAWIAGDSIDAAIDAARGDT